MDLHTLVGKTIKSIDDTINYGQVYKINFTDCTHVYFTVDEDCDISITEEPYEP